MFVERKWEEIFHGRGWFHWEARVYQLRKVHRFLSSLLNIWYPRNVIIQVEFMLVECKTKQPSSSVELAVSDDQFFPIFIIIPTFTYIRIVELKTYCILKGTISDPSVLQNTGYLIKFLWKLLRYKNFSIVRKYRGNLFENKQVYTRGQMKFVC